MSWEDIVIAVVSAVFIVALIEIVTSAAWFGILAWRRS